MASPFLYFPGERLSQAELSAACLDGHLIALGEGFVPADLIETAPLRAASLTALLGDALAASHLSAAWVYDGVDDPPARHSVQRAVLQRLHHVIDRRVIYHDPRIGAGDLRRVGGVLVTTPARTAADLARTPGDGHPEGLRSWSARDPEVAELGLSWLAAHPRIPHRRRAVELLAELRAARQEVDAGQEEVTR
ncbi:hypothetical protein F6B41_18205 [Microbacterium lushaniae]|nr:hypothetical protein F6B41_20320 [Microbacterium lushaniae]KAA9152384.1 hypothetical protein F6B41_18205 [Microbacterium lushaniae]